MKKMHRQARPFAARFIAAAIVLLILGSGRAGQSQPVVELVLDPLLPDNAIQLGAGANEVWIEARTQKPEVSLTWKLDGPGQFTALENGLGGIYNAPDKIEGESAKVVITATATLAGKKTPTSIAFTVLAPIAEPTPTPLPTATPTPLPEPVKIRSVSLKHDRFYVRAGETATLLIDTANPSNQAVSITCTALKGKTECSAPAESASGAPLAIEYAAPESPGKDMVEVKITSAAGGETEQALIKIEILQ